MPNPAVLIIDDDANILTVLSMRLRAGSDSRSQGREEGSRRVVGGRYAVGLVTDAADGRRFVDRLTGPEGERILRSVGFGAP